MIDEIPIGKLVPNTYNPRKHFDDAKMKELEGSIKGQGLVQAITVRPIDGGKYEVVAGMRRYTASKNAGLKKIPAMVLELSDEQAILLSITENLERADLSPIEEAKSFQVYLGWDEQRYFEGRRPRQDISALVQKLANKLPVSERTIRNRLSLLHLPDSLQTQIEQKTLEIKVAQAISRLKDLWKIRTVGMEDDEINDRRDEIKASIHTVMEDIAKTVQDEAHARERVNKYIEAEQMNIEKRDALASRQKQAFEDAEKKLIEFFGFIEALPSNWSKMDTDAKLEWVKLHIDSNIKQLSDEKLDEISITRESLSNQHDRYLMNLTYVKELVIDTCPHCGAGISISFLDQKIEEIQEELKVLSDSESELGGELKEWRGREKTAKDLGREYTTKGNTYRASIREEKDE